MPFTENISEFLDPADFAHAATYTPDGGSPIIVNGIFDNEYFDEVGGRVGVEGSTPAFHCADISGVAQGDALTVNGTAYKVINVQPDGTGLTTLYLQEQ